ncbi:MAG: hypothetical protein HRU70_00580 [Phycisphaeraceae bacterium]|nr:MAG: hypothetical protein HRU70_00580 [Phycisphaeraceae bacterium]
MPWLEILAETQRQAATRGLELAVFAAGLLIGLVAGVGGWSMWRRHRRAVASRKARRRIWRRDGWAESADRIATPSPDELERQFKDTPKGPGTTP